MSASPHAPQCLFYIAIMRTDRLNTSHDQTVKTRKGAE